MANTKRLTKYEFNKIKTLLENNSVSKVVRLSDRGSSTVTLISLTKSLEDFHHIRGRYRLLRNNGQRIPISRIAEDYYLAREPEVKTDIIEKNISENIALKSPLINNLDEALAKLDSQIEALKESITQVITLAVEQQIKEELASKDEKIAEYEEIMEEVKKSNWIDNIKRNLTLR